MTENNLKPYMFEKDEWHKAYRNGVKDVKKTTSELLLHHCENM